MKHIRRFCRYCLLLACLLPFQPIAEANAAEVQSQVLVQPGSGEMPLLPYLDIYIDETLSMDIEEAAAPGLAASYRTFSLENLPRVEGIAWLRFTISPLPPEAKPATFLLDMGQSIPGRPILFDPEKNELSGALEWHENTPAHRNILLLPEEGSQPVTCYIRLAGLPGPWFYPVIRTPQNAASNLLGLSRTGALLALAVVMLLCLLRGASEKGQWRIWTGLYVAVALAQGLLGMPEISQNFGALSLAAVLMPGIALMLLPHVGRHLLDTPQQSRSLDIQLFLLSLPGAALALLPLLPGFHWLERWLDLWPIGTILFAPTALGAWIGGLAGAKRFLLACLVPPLFTAFAWAGIDFGFPANFLASLPLWGVALSALLLVTGSGKNAPAHKDGKSASPALSGAEAVINLENPLGDPHLRMVAPAAPEPAQDNKLALAEIPEEKSEEMDWLQARENALREPLDEILRQSAALGECSLPPAVRQYAEQMIAAACHMADVMGGIVPVRHEAAEKPERARPFNLQQLLRQVHSSVAAGAETTGTALSWYMPPHLYRMFRGEPDELKAILSMLLESAVRASRNGSVHLSARRAPGSAEPGHILFTITDNGSGAPPRERSTLAIARAWEMIGRTGGYLALEAAPTGVSVAMFIRLEELPEEDDNEDLQKTGLILAGDDQGERRDLLRILADLPCRIRQASSMGEVLEAQRNEAVPLLLATGKLARPAAADMTHKFCQLAAKAGFKNCNILAVTPDDSEWDLLKPSGFTHAMISSTDADSIKKTVADLLHNLALSNQVGARNDAQDAQAANIDSPPETGASDDNVSEAKASANGREGAPEEPPLASGSVEKSNPGAIRSASAGRRDEHFEGPEWLNSISAADNIESQNPEESPARGSFANIENENATQAGSKVEAIKSASSAAPANGGLVLDNQPASPGSIKESKNIAADKETGAFPTNSVAQAESSSFLDYIVGVGPEQPEDAENASSPRNVAHEADNSQVGSSPAVRGPFESQSMEFQLQAEARPEAGGKGSQESGIDPLVADLVMKLDQAMDDTRQAFLQRDCAKVASATDNMATTSEKVGLRLLARMARCVERAARANDLPAINDLLPDLETAVERNRIALKQKTGH